MVANSPFILHTKGMDSILPLAISFWYTKLKDNVITRNNYITNTDFRMECIQPHLQYYSVHLYQIQHH